MAGTGLASSIRKTLWQESLDMRSNISCWVNVARGRGTKPNDLAPLDKALNDDATMAAMENDFAHTTISLYGTVPDSIVDGPGLRYAVFVQGCSHGCPGCHNPESQPAEGGTETTLADLLADIRANGLVHDVTLSGGEPFEQPEACAALAHELKRDGYGIWCYTGYLYDDLARRTDPAIVALLDAIDVLVDGPFVESRKSLELKWCGSSNQRLIDVPATRRTGSIVEWQPTSFVPEKPSNW